MRKLATLIALVALTSVASAAMMQEYLYDITMTNITGGSQPGGVDWTVNRFKIDTTVDWTTAELVVTPTDANQIHQYWYTYRDNRVDNDASISSTDIGYDGNTARYDTFITDELLVNGTAVGEFSFWDYDGTKVYTGAAAETEISVTFFTTATDEIGTSMYLAQVTILETCNSGTWLFNAYNADSASVPIWELSGNIVNGALVPEPATMLMLIGGGVGVFMRRRKKK